MQVAEVSDRHDLGQRLCTGGLLGQQSQNLPGLFEEARLLGFASAEVHHQLKQLRPGEALDDGALPLVEFGRLLRVLHVAVGAGVAVLAVPGDEVDAGAPAHLRVCKAALAGQQREELRHDGIVLQALLAPLPSIRAHGAHWAHWAGAACGGRLVLMELLRQVRGLLGEGAHIAAHGVLLAGSLQAEADAAHAPRRRALRTGPAGTARHVLY